MDFTFRKLKADDIFLLTNLFSKIGLKEIKNALDPNTVAKAVTVFSSKTNDDSKTDVVRSLGLTFALDIANILVSNLSSCKNEIYEILASVSGMTTAEIAELDLITFTRMIVEFVKKDEFADFFKVVSKSFK